MELTEHEQWCLEAAAQLLHERRHRLGTGQVCDRCRSLARSVAAVLWSDPGVSDGDDPALREVVERFELMDAQERETFVQVSRSMTGGAELSTDT